MTSLLSAEDRFLSFSFLIALVSALLSSCGGDISSAPYCADGYFSSEKKGGTCQRQAICEPGQFISQAGTDRVERICKDCPEGSFSSVENSESCQTWRSCPDSYLGPGSATTDVDCELDVVSLVAGGYHYCTLLSDKTVKCWGSNARGQLGDGSLENRSQPTRVIGLSGVVSIAAWGDISCAVTERGEAYCWGGNEHGQIGDGNIGTDHAQPYLIPGIADATQIATNYNHSCALLRSGLVYCWGDNSSGGLGDGTRNISLRPVQVLGLSDAVEIIVTQSMSCARKSDGRVACWGDDYHDYLGLTALSVDTSRPIIVPELSDVASLSSGTDRGCAILKSGMLKCWGSNQSGELGGVNVEKINQFFVLDSESRYVAMSWIRSVTCAIKQDSTVSCWGSIRNLFRWLQFDDKNQKEAIDIPELSGATQVALGRFSGCALYFGNDVRCWGSADWGQLGDGTWEYSAEPLTVPALANVVSIAAGYNFSCAIKKDGRVVCWGAEIISSASVILDENPMIMEIPDLEEVVSLSCGLAHCCALTKGHQVWCWGWHEQGQLGSTPSMGIWERPQLISELSDVVEVAGGGKTSCALTRDGVAWCWGGQEFGDSISYPQVVSGLDTGIATKIAISGDHACVLFQDGTLKCWGRNTRGQLGDGTQNSEINDPVYASGLIAVQNVAVSRTNSCALLFDGTVKCWGDNGSGQIGNGSVSSVIMTPTLVENLAGVTKIGLGEEYVCALLFDGTVKCWGENYSGTLGDGSFSDSSLAENVLGLSSVVDLAVGGGHSCALLQDGTVKCWGNNSSEQLGQFPVRHVLWQTRFIGMR